MLKNDPVDEMKPSGSVDMPLVKGCALSGNPVMGAVLMLLGPLGVLLCLRLLALEIG